MFFFKQKTAYEMRISDWSSDLCSSDPTDLPSRNAPGDEGADHLRHGDREVPPRLDGQPVLRVRDVQGGHLVTPAQHVLPMELHGFGVQSGRASCRERVCQYV